MKRFPQKDTEDRSSSPSRFSHHDVPTTKTAAATTITVNANANATTSTNATSFVDRLPSRNVSFSHAEIMSVPELSSAIYHNAFPPSLSSSSCSSSSSSSSSSPTTVQNHQVRITGVILHETLGNIIVDPHCNTRKVGEYLILGDPLFVPSLSSSSSLSSSPLSSSPLSSSPCTSSSNKFRSRVRGRNRNITPPQNAATGTATGTATPLKRNRTKFQKVQEMIQRQCQEGRDMVVVNVSNVDLGGHSGDSGNGNGNRNNRGGGRGGTTFRVGDLVTVMGTVWLASLHVDEDEMEELQKMQEANELFQLETVARLIGEYRWMRDDDGGGGGGGDGTRMKMKMKMKEENKAAIAAAAATTPTHSTHPSHHQERNGNHPLTTSMEYENDVTNSMEMEMDIELQPPKTQIRYSDSQSDDETCYAGAGADNNNDLGDASPIIQRTCGFIEARIVLNVNGIDVNLFLEALKMRRRYLNQWQGSEEKVFRMSS